MKMMKSLPLDQKHVYLVTPSASRKVVFDWVQNDMVGFTSVIHTWVPVAPLSFLHMDHSYLYSLKTTSVRIHAVYGREDEGGKKVSALLGDEAGATVEIKGGHPCYLDSPDAFVEIMRLLVADA